MKIQRKFIIRFAVMIIAVLGYLSILPEPLGAEVGVVDGDAGEIEVEVCLE